MNCGRTANLLVAVLRERRIGGDFQHQEYRRIPLVSSWEDSRTGNISSEPFRVDNVEKLP